MLQVLRHDFSNIYLPLLLTFILFNIILIFKFGNIFTPSSYVSLNLWIFYVLTIYISAMTFFYGNLSDFITALPRMLLMPLTTFFLYNFIKKKKQFNQILNIYLFFGLLGSISLIFQLYYGPLEFLSSAATRNDLDRYSTSFGSLTSYGGTVGILLLVLVLIKPSKNLFTNFLGITLFSLCGLVTLSKAGLINVVLFSLIFIFFIKLKYKLFCMILSILLLYLTYLYFPEVSIYIQAAIKGLSIGSKTYVVSSLETQAIDRITKAVPKLMEHSIYNNFFGFGLIGGQGAFGLPFSQSGTTHNQYTEFFNIGGIFLFINVLALLVSIMKRLFELRRKDNLARLFFYCNLLAIINMFFFNGFLYQPYSSFVLWLSIVYILNEEKINHHEKNL